MVDSLLDFALGPFRSISDYYFQNQSIFNSIVIGAVLLKMIVHKKRTNDKSTG